MRGDVEITRYENSVIKPKL